MKEEVQQQNILTNNDNNIFYYLNNGQQDKCITLVKDNPDLINSTEDQYGLTILHLASQRKMFRLVKLILNLVYNDDDEIDNNNNNYKSQFDIDRVDLNQNTALHYACASSISEINPSSLTKANNNNNSNVPALGPKSITDHIPTVEDGADNYLVDDTKSNRFNIVKLLLERGSNPNLGNKQNYFPIHLACKEIDFYTVELLIDYDANAKQSHRKIIEVSNYSLQLRSLLPLSKYEEKRGNEKKEKLISKLENGTSVSNGPTCLHLCLSNLKKIKEITEKQYQERLKKQSPNNNNNKIISNEITPNIRIEKDHPLIKLIKLLCQKGCSPNQIDQVTGYNSFTHFICQWPTTNEDEYVKLVDTDIHEQLWESLVQEILLVFYHQYHLSLEKCSETSLDDQPGETPLGYCSMYSTRTLILRQILSSIQSVKQEVRDTIIEATNSRLQTPLFIAASIGNGSGVDELLEAGANPNHPDQFGNT
eukprot:gene9299-11399_t